MMKRFLVFAGLAALSFQAAYAQTGGATPSAKQIKAGEVVQLGEGLTLRVAKATKSAFADVKVKGEPVVVVLDLEGSKKGATLFYKLNADPKLSDVQLTVGTQRLAPRAVVEDFPSWGKDNDKEVDIVDSKAGVGSTTINFEKKGSVSLLFDVPPEQAKTPQKLSLMLRTIKPNDQRYSFVVSL
jgi:hypothetical protein